MNKKIIANLMFILCIISIVGCILFYRMDLPVYFYISSVMTLSTLFYNIFSAMTEDPSVTESLESNVKTTTGLTDTYNKAKKKLDDDSKKDK